MEAAHLIKGIILGFTIAAPVGPIAMLCIHRTLASGIRAGLLTGLGAATADGIYGAVAGFGISTVSGFLVGHALWFQIPGSLFLCWLGGQNIVRPPSLEGPPPGGRGRIFLGTLALTLANPMTIMVFGAVFSGLGNFNTARSTPQAAALVLGVFLGSCLWWIILCLGTRQLGRGFTPGLKAGIQRGAGVVLLGFGLFALAQAVLP